MNNDEKNINGQEDTVEEVEIDTCDTTTDEQSKQADDTKEAKDNDQLEALQKQLDEEKDKYVRLYAEFQNYKNRTTKEKTETYNNAVVKCIEDILPVIDNFERALSQECVDDTFKSGMEMILKQFITILEKMGVKEIDAMGKPFDPKFHNAIQQVETDEYESDTVCGVFQKGYVLGERLVRPAMVKVSQ